MKTITILLLSAFFSASLFSQTTLQGSVTDAETGEPIIFGTVALYKKDVLITGTETDFDGFYSVTELDAGTYNVVFSYTGYSDYKVVDVVVMSGKTNQLNAKMPAKVELEKRWTCGCCFRPLISKDDTSQGFKFDAVEIGRIAF